MDENTNEHRNIYERIGKLELKVNTLHTEVPYIKGSIKDLKDALEKRDEKQDLRWTMVARLLAGAGITLLFTVLGIILSSIKAGGS